MVEVPIEDLGIDEWQFPAMDLSLSDLQAVTFFAHCTDRLTPLNPVICIETTDSAAIGDLEASLAVDEEGVLQKVHSSLGDWLYKGKPELNLTIEEGGEYWLNINPNSWRSPNTHFPSYEIMGLVGNTWVDRTFIRQRRDLPFRLGPYKLLPGAEVKLKNPGHTGYQLSLYRSVYQEAIPHQDWLLYEVELDLPLGGREEVVICGAAPRIGLLSEKRRELRRSLDHSKAPHSFEMMEFLGTLDWSAMAVFVIHSPGLMSEQFEEKDRVKTVREMSEDTGWEPEEAREYLDALLSLEGVAVEVFHTPSKLLVDFTLPIPDEETGALCVKFWESFKAFIVEKGHLNELEGFGFDKYVITKFFSDFEPCVDGDHIRASLEFKRYELARFSPFAK